MGKTKGLTPAEQEQVVRIQLQIDAIEKNAKALGKAVIELQRLNVPLPAGARDKAGACVTAAGVAINDLNKELNAITQKAPLYEGGEE